MLMLIIERLSGDKDFYTYSNRKHPNSYRPGISPLMIPVTYAGHTSCLLPEPSAQE
jgi:hypothetical protein